MIRNQSNSMSVNLRVTRTSRPLEPGRYTVQATRNLYLALKNLQDADPELHIDSSLVPSLHVDGIRLESKHRQEHLTRFSKSGWTRLWTVQENVQRGK